MKKYILILSILISSMSFSQNINMQNGTFNQCSGNFYDSGGAGALYGDNETFTMTICPDTPGMFVQVEFVAFSTQMTSDVMTIYDGDSNAAPSLGDFSGNQGTFQVNASVITNATGCLTFEWVSDGATVGNGWEGRISCYMPCQTINSQIDTASPVPDPADGVIKVCQNQQIDLTGSGIFSVDGTGATYEWDLGDGNTIVGQTASFSYPDAGVYIVNLSITDTNPQGCSNTNLINQVIQVSSDSDFTGTQAAENSICFGDSTTIDGVVTPVMVTNNCAPPESNLTFLPDDNGTTFYETSITVECYDPAATLNDVSELNSICLVMEHSYLADLVIQIISPTGQSVILHNRGGDSANLGEPWATGVADGNSGNVTPGVGYEYCIVPDTSLPTMASGIQTGGVFTNGNGPGTYTDSYLPAGNYNSVNPLTGLVGSLLNGTWTIRITDNAGQDNGYIFSWGINFDPSLLPPDFSFTPAIVSEAWDADPSITNTTGNAITVAPATAGQHCYTYRVVDDFGCEYTEQVCIDVNPEIITEEPNDITVCDANGPPIIFDLTENTPVLLAIAPNAGDLVVTYHETMANAQNDLSPISTPDMYTGTDGQVIYTRIEYLMTGCYVIETFNLFGGTLPIANLVMDMVVCDDISNDGIEFFDLTTQETTVIGTQNPTDIIVTYHTSQTDADTNIGAIAVPAAYANIASPETIFVRVEANNSASCFDTTSFNLVVNSLPELQDVTLLQCDEDGIQDGLTIYNLEQANPDMLLVGDVADYIFTYYLSQVDAQTENNPQNGLPFTNTVNPQTVFTRVQHITTGCFNTAQIILDVTATDIGVTSLEVCDDDYDGLAQFNLNDATSIILTGLPVGSQVFYYENETDAQLELNELPIVYANTVPSLQTIFVRAENQNDCYGIATMDLIVNPLAENNPINDIAFCSDTAGVLNNIDLTQFDAEVLGMQNPADFIVTYHEALTDAENGTGALTSPYTNSVNPQPIFVRVESQNTGCGMTFVDFEITIHTNPPLNTVTSLQLCDDSVPDGITQFNLTVKDDEFTGGNTDFVVDYYETLLDAQNNTSLIPDYTSYTNTSVGGLPANPQTLYVRITDTSTTSNCFTINSLDIEVLSNPLPETDLNDLILCDDNNTGDELEVFDLTLNEAQIFNGQPYTATYHTNLEDANQNIDIIPTPAAFTNTENPQTIYVRVDNDNSCDAVVVEFDLIVNPLPDVIAITDFIECELNTDGLFDFDLESKTDEILNGQSPAIFAVTYHETLAQAEDDTSVGLISPYQNILGNPQPIFVRITNTTTGCSISTQQFNIEVRNQPTATQPAQEYVICDYSGDNDGFAEFDLATQDAEILNGQLPADYMVTYFADQMDAIDNVNALPNNYVNTSNPQVIYARVSNSLGVCYELTEVTLRVQLAPVFTLEDSYIICLDRNGNVITTADSPPVIDTGLTDADYDFEWRYEGTVIAGETMPTLTAMQAGNYSITVTETITGLGCMSTETTIVNPSSPPVVDATVVSDAFANNHMIEVVATGTGVYEFSLDGGPWELGTDNGNGSYTHMFNNVNPPGEHSIVTRDVNGCGMDEDSVFVFDYPLYFTPNGDGYNDTWNIIDFSVQPTAKIFIYDRYGKLLKQISPTGSGWTGMYNGKPLPSSDYWFTVTYNEPRNGDSKQFKAHFTLKR